MEPSSTNKTKTRKSGKERWCDITHDLDERDFAKVDDFKEDLEFASPFLAVHVATP